MDRKGRPIIQNGKAGLIGAFPDMAHAGEGMTVDASDRALHPEKCWARIPGTTSSPVSGIAFKERGQHVRRGLFGEWPLFAVTGATWSALLSEGRPRDAVRERDDQR